MKKTLKVILRSDLCAGTGKGFAAVIDEDTAVDKYGMPFIPGKRIKGCLRELAVDIFEYGEDKLNELFGAPGRGIPGTLTIGNAMIKDYDSELEEIKTAIQTGKIKANDITELFCSSRANTAMENDTVKDKSLRFSRVVNRTSPITNDDTVFYADVEFEQKDEEDIEKLFKALKHIGYHRNRGLGYIGCELLPKSDSFSLEKKVFEESKIYRISYVVYLRDGVMLPASDTFRSLDYIPGTSVLGAMAKKYIKKYGETEFNDYFFSPDVIFGNLYISDRMGTQYIPSPAFFAKIKAAKADHIYNMIANAEADERKDTPPQYKPLKSGYISIEKGHKESNTEIVYHNAINTKESIENKGGLYTQYCLEANQYFKGYIDVTGKKAAKIYSLFEDGSLNFGRSKNSQYSHCDIEKNIGVEEIRESEAELKSNTVAAYLCESDIVLMKDGRYTCTLRDICEQLGVDSSEINRFTKISTRVVSGYNAKWNMKKPQFPVIKAGSCIVFDVEKDEKRSECINIGAKLNEGYGRMRLIADVKNFVIKDGKDTYVEPDDTGSLILKEIDKRAEERKILEKAVEDGPKISLNSSQVGRIILMCKESNNLEDFISRINSIKTDETRMTAKKYFGEDALQSSVQNDTGDWNVYKKYIINALTVKKYKLREETK